MEGRRFLAVSWSDDERRDELFDLIESKEKRRRGSRFFCSCFCSSESGSSLGGMPDISVQLERFGLFKLLEHVWCATWADG